MVEGGVSRRVSNLPEPPERSDTPFREIPLSSHIAPGKPQQNAFIESFDRTAHSAICRQPPTPKSPLLECNGTGRFRYVGAPRPVPLHHRAIRAQMKPGLYSSADEAWGSGHRACRQDGAHRLGAPALRHNVRAASSGYLTPRMVGFRQQPALMSAGG